MTKRRPDLRIRMGGGRRSRLVPSIWISPINLRNWTVFMMFRVWSSWFCGFSDGEMRYWGFEPLPFGSSQHSVALNQMKQLC
jgi:hypothetical protein